ncbi:hypothetical protein QTO02_18590, partial [Vibrio fortis]
IPPLRTRKEDIPALTEFLVQQKCKRLNLIETPRMSPAVIDQLMSYDWPGNVRELENVIERSLILSEGRELKVEDLLLNTPRREQPQAPTLGGSRPMTLDEVTRKHIIEVLNSVDGKVHGSNGAAAILNVNPSTLRSRMNKLGIVYGRSS